MGNLVRKGEALAVFRLVTVDADHKITVFFTYLARGSARKRGKQNLDTQAFRNCTKPDLDTRKILVNLPPNLWRKSQILPRGRHYLPIVLPRFVYFHP